MLRLVLLLVLAYIIVRGVKRLLAEPSGPARGEGRTRTYRAADGERPPHEVLGVAASATQEEIRAAYQRLMRENHPDRVADMSPEIRELAETRSKEINRAYDRLRRA